MTKRKRKPFFAKLSIKDAKESLERHGEYLEKRRKQLEEEREERLKLLEQIAKEREESARSNAAELNKQKEVVEQQKPKRVLEKPAQREQEKPKQKVKLYDWKKPDYGSYTDWGTPLDQIIQKDEQVRPPLVANSDLLIYSELNQLNKAKTAKEIQIAKYDNDIQVLTNKRDQLTSLLNELMLNMSNGRGYLGFGSYNAKVANDLSSQIDDLNVQIGKVLKEKDRYINIYNNYTDPSLRSQGMLGDIALSSDYGQMVYKAKDYSKEMAELARKQRPGGDNAIFVFGDQSAYKEAATSFVIQSNRVESYANQVEKFIDYVNSIHYLPKSDEIPDQYKDIATKMFTKDGKLLLDDLEFRLAYGLNSIVPEYEFDFLSNVAKKAAEKGEANLSDEFINNKLEELKIKADAELLSMDDRQYHNALPALASGDERTGKMLEYNTAQRLLEKAKLHKQLNEEILAYQEKGNDFATGFAAFREFIAQGFTNPLSVTDAIDSRNIVKALQKFLNGEELNTAEKEILKSAFIENVYHGNFGNYENVNAYKWSNIAAESLQFMMEFILTRGQLSMMEATGKGLAKKATKAATNKIRKATLNQLARRGVHGTVKYTTEVVGRLAADGIYSAALSNTLGLPRVLKDTYDSMQGRINGNIDNQGNVNINGIGSALDFKQSFKRSLIRNWIENASEMMGEWGMGKLLYQGGKRAIPSVGKLLTSLEKSFERNATNEARALVMDYLTKGITRTNGIMSKIGLGKYIPKPSAVFNKNVLKAGQFHGFLGEVSEEYYGLIMQHAFGVQDDDQVGLWDDMVKQTADIWGGIAVSTGVLGALGMGTSIFTQMRYNNSEQNLAKAFGKQTADEIRRQLLFADSWDIIDTYKRLAEEYGHANKRSFFLRLKMDDISQAQAFTEYVDSLLKLRGAVFGEDVVANSVGRERHRLLTEALNRGYAAGTYAHLNMINKVSSVLRADAESVLIDTRNDPKDLQSESPLDRILRENDGDIFKIIQGIRDGSIQLNEGVDVNDALNKLVAYHNSIKYKEGVDLRLSDLAQERVARGSRVVERLRNRHTGDIRVMHKLMLNEDGTISDKDLKLFIIDSPITEGEGKGLPKVKINGEMLTDPKAYGSENAEDVRFLVSDGSGMYRYVKLSELEGWSVYSGSLSVELTLKDIKERDTLKEWRMRERYLKSLGDNPIAGDEVYIGDKKLTILDASRHKGIVYAISDEDGENAKIYHVRNAEQLKDKVEEEWANFSTDITKFFTEDAAKMIRDMMNEIPRMRALIQQKDEEERMRIEAAEEDRLDRLNSEIEEWHNSADQLGEDEVEDYPVEETELTEEETPAVEDSEEPTETPEPQPIDDEDDENPAPEPIQDDEDTIQLNSEITLEPEIIPQPEESPEVTPTPEPKREDNSRKHVDNAITAEQNKSLEDLVEAIAEARDRKIASAGGHYFMKGADGKIELWRRAHSVLGQQSIRTERLENEIRSVLNRLKNTNDLSSEIDKIIEEKSDKYRQEFASLGDLYKSLLLFQVRKDLYLEYLEKNPSERDEILETIAETLCGTANQSVIVGNVYDVLARELLDYRVNIDDVTYETVVKNKDDRFSTYWFGKKVGIAELIQHEYLRGNRPTVTTFTLLTEEAFDKIKSELKKVREYYENQLGWRLCTDPYTLTGILEVRGKDVKVAGETDCVAVDKDGNYHLIDFKTYNAETKQYFTGNHSETTFYDNPDPTFFKFSTAVQYARQLNLYKLLSHQNDRFFETVEALLFGIQYQTLGEYGISIDGENVKHSWILVPDSKESNVGVIPNRVNLDNVEGQNEDIREHLNKFEIKQPSTSEYEKQKSWIDSDDSHIVTAEFEKFSPTLEARINEVNAERDGLKERNVSNDQDAINQFIKDVIEFREKLAGVKEELSKELEDRDKLKRRQETLYNQINRGTKRTDNEMLELLKTIEDEIVVLLSSYSKFDKNGMTVNIDEMSDQDRAELLDKTVTYAKILEYCSFRNTISENNQVRKSIGFLNSRLKKILNKFGFTTTFNDRVNDNTFVAEPESESKSRIGLLITGLIDSAENEEFTVEKSIITISGEHVELGDTMTAERFIDDGEFYIQRGKKINGKDTFYLVVKYNGHEYPQVRINFAHDKNGNFEESNALYQNLTTLLTNEGDRVKVNNKAISRTFGKFKPSEEGNPIITDEKIKELTGLSFKDLVYDAQLDRIGITKTVTIEGKTYLIVRAPNSSNKTGRQLYEYKRQSVSPGGVVILYRPNYSEVDSQEARERNEVVPVNLETLNFDAGSAELVADILSGKHSNLEGSGIEDILNSNFIQDGVEYPISNRTVLQLFISYGNHNLKGEKEHVHLSVEEDNRTGHPIAVIRGFITGLSKVSDTGDLKIHESSYDLNNTEERQLFINFLQENVRMLVYEHMMESKSMAEALGNKEELSPSRSRDESWFDRTGKSELKFGNSEISIKKGDINLSGISWYIKSGMLRTKFNGLTRPLISFDENNLLNTTPEVIPASSEKAADVDEHIIDNDPFKNLGDLVKRSKENLEGDEYDPDELFKRVSSTENTYGTINEDEARQHIQDIVGDIGVQFEDDVLYSLGNSVVVGACKVNLIRLSKKAQSGVEYHEAFHRVLELLVSEKLRNKAYSKYRARFEKRNPGKTITDQEIAELAADEFWYYKENNPMKGFKFSLNFIEMFKTLKNWYKFYNEIGSFTLYKLYRSAANGKYRNIKPSQEAIERFKKFTESGYLPYTIRTASGKEIKMQHVENRYVYDAVVNTIRYVAMDPRTYKAVGQKFDITGKHLNELTITGKTLAQSPVMLGFLTSPTISTESKLKLVDVLGLKTAQDGSLELDKDGNLQFVDDRLESIIADIVKDMSKWQMPAMTGEELKNLDEKNKLKRKEEDDVIDTTDTDDPTVYEGEVGSTIEYGEYTTQSYEIDPITRATPRVKFFFSLIEDFAEIKTITPEGVVAIQHVRKLNAAGLPQMMDFKEAWGIVINRLHDVTSIKELESELKRLSEVSELFKAMYEKYKLLMRRAYEHDASGKIIYDENGMPTVKDDDAMGTLNELTSTIHHAKIIPVVGKSFQKNEFDEGVVKIESSDMEYLSRNIRSDWSSAISSGSTRYLSRDINGKYKVDSKGIDKAYSWLNQFANLLFSGKYTNELISITIQYNKVQRGSNGKNKLTGEVLSETYYGDRIKQEVDNNNQVVLDALRNKFVEILRDFGIGIETKDLEYMLEQMYGGVDKTAMTNFAKDLLHKDTHWLSSFESACKKIKDTGNANYSKTIDQIWSNLAGSGLFQPLVLKLSLARYNRISDESQLQYVTIDGKRQYAMCEPNFLTQRLDEILKNRFGLFDQLKADPYNVEIGVEGEILGCRILNAILNNSVESKLEFLTIPGFKTDAAGSRGVPYTKLSEQDDYALKYGMLASNYIILCTASDKTTYGGIKGMGAFGIDFAKPGGYADIHEYISRGQFSVTSDTNGVHVTFNNDVVDQFIDYAFCEYNSALLELNRIEQGLVPKSQMVQNFHRGLNVKGHNVIQGARLSTFTGIFREDGIYVSFNDVLKSDGTYMSERECLTLAKNEFFGKSPQQRRVIMNRVLTNQVQKELKKLELIGFIKSQVDADGITRYQNVHLDRSRLKTCQRVLANGDATFTYIKTNDTNNIHSNALVMYVADMVAKAQMSMQECTRIYTGSLSFYKWEYDSNGKLKHITADYFKRTGGLVSTGTHNLVDIPGVSNKVVCAEIYDEIIKSDFLEEFEEKAAKQDRINAIRDIVKHNDRIAEELGISDKDGSRIEDVLKDLSEDQLREKLKDALIKQRKYEISKDGVVTKEQLSEIQSDVENQLNSADNLRRILTEKFKNVNVNDGATYVSDEFCERLLKSIGKWDKSIAEAFKILRGFDKNINNQSMRGEDLTRANDAYNKIYTSVIGALKYTGFGLRPTTVTVTDDNGNPVTYTRNVTFYDKTAYFPLFSCMASGNMKAVIKKMKQSKVDVLKVTSATKVGNQGAVEMDQSTFDKWNDPETGRASFDSFELNTYEQKLSDIRKQFNTDPKEKELMPLGTQYQKVLLTLLTSDITYTVDGKQIKSEDMVLMIMNAYKKIVAIGVKDHENKFYKNGELDAESFVKILKRQLSDRDANDPILKALTVEIEEITDDDGKVIGEKSRLRLPVAALSANNWIESIVTSIVNKDIIDVVTPGAAFYQRSAWAMEGVMSSDILDDIDFGKSDEKYVINAGRKLLELNEEGSTDCVLSIDFFNYLFEQIPSLKHQSFTVKKNWLIKHGIISGFSEKVENHVAEKGDTFLVIEDGKSKIVHVTEESGLIGTTIKGKIWKNATANIVGYRIPTQAVSSIHALRCVDVIPVVRDTIILPKEITAVTGSDYDIDKFFLSTKYYKWVNDEYSEETLKALEENINTYGEELGRVKTEELMRSEHHLSEKFEEDDKKCWCNMLINYQLAILKSSGNNISKLHGSIDADTAILDEIRDELSRTNEEIQAFDATSLRNNIDAKLNFSIGKTGIGPFALNNNNHVYTMLYGVKFKHEEGGILDLLGLEDLSRSTDRNGHPIMSWLSGLINAHVDVAKDPKTRLLGMNPYTYNLVNLLIRTGYGKQTFWFTTQPMMREFYNAYFMASGVYHQDETISVYTRANNSINDVIVNYVNDNFKVSGKKVKSFDAAITMFSDMFESNHGVNVYNAIKSLMNTTKGVSVMKDISTHDYENDKNFDLGNGLNLSLAEIQMLVAIANSELQKKAQQLSNLVQYTKIDTKKHGKNSIEQKHYLDQYNKLRDAEKSPFEHDSIIRMLDDSFIDEKTKKAILAESRLMSSQLYQCTQGFRDVLLPQVQLALNKKNPTENLMEAISEMIVAKIKSDYFFKGKNSYCALRSIDPLQLMSGKNSIYKQLYRIKNGILNRNDSRFDSIRDKNTGLCNNYLLNRLIGGDIAGSDILYNDQGVVEGFKRTYEDEWLDALFIQNMNMFDDSVKSSDMMNAWEELLNSSNADLARFAEQLVVYAFMTSVDNGGRFDLFKYVPPAWHTGECDILRTLDSDQTYGSWTEKKIRELNSGETSQFSAEELQEMILNFSWDDRVVTTVSKEKLQTFEKAISNVDLGYSIVGAIRSDSQSFRLIFDSEQYPTYFKVKSLNTKYRSGSAKYVIYKFYGMARRKILGTDQYFEYPVYASVKPSGFLINGGQKIFTMGIEHGPNTSKMTNYRNVWAHEFAMYFGKDISIPNVDKAVDATQLLTALVYGYANDSDVRATVIKIKNNLLSKVRMAPTEVFILELASNEDNVRGFEIFDSSRDRYDEYISELNVDKIDDRYKPIDEKSVFEQKDSNGRTAFDRLLVDLIRKTVNVEFYKKQWRDGKGHNKVMAVSIKNNNAAGFFEVVPVVDENRNYTGEYDIHFKSYSLKADNYDYEHPENNIASVPLQSSEIMRLMQQIIKSLRPGSVISTQGQLSKGGVSAMEKLGKSGVLTTGYLHKIEERTVDSKEEGELYNIPVYVKTAGPEISEIADYTKLPDVNQVEESKVPNKVFAYNFVSQFGKQLTSVESVDQLINNNEHAKHLLKQSGNAVINSDELSNDVIDKLYAVRMLLLNDMAEDTVNSCKINK